METVPDAITNVAYTVASSTNGNIYLTWDVPTGSALGGSNLAITSYTVQRDGSDIATGLAVAFLDDDNAAALLTGGTSYSYTVLAINAYGAGAYSTALVVVAAQVPDTPAAPTVTGSGTYIQIAFTAPASNGNAAIDVYQILIIDGTTTYVEDTAAEMATNLPSFRYSP